MLTFDEARSKETAEEFVSDVLASALRTRLVVVGADFHFGYRRHGDVPLLQRMGAELGFEVLGLGLVASADGTTAADSAPPYSSTRVRSLLGAGDVAEAAAHPRPARTRCADRWSTVTRAGVSSASRPRTSRCPSGCACRPTACTPAPSPAPTACARAAAISLGRRPTFYAEAGMRLLEAYVLDFDGDLYGQLASVAFLHRLRGQERFANVDDLVAQMHRDVAETRRLLRCSRARDRPASAPGAVPERSGPSGSLSGRTRT